jgi:hypothetical protein
MWSLEDFVHFFEDIETKNQRNLALHKKFDNF